MSIEEEVALKLMDKLLVRQPRRSGKTTKVIDKVKQELLAGRDAIIISGVRGLPYPRGIRVYYYCDPFMKLFHGFHGKFFTDDLGPYEVAQLRSLIGEDNFGGGYYTPKGGY